MEPVEIPEVIQYFHTKILLTSKEIQIQLDYTLRESSLSYSTIKR